MRSKMFIWAPRAPPPPLLLVKVPSTARARLYPSSATKLKQLPSVMISLRVRYPIIVPQRLGNFVGYDSSSNFSVTYHLYNLSFPLPPLHTPFLVDTYTRKTDTRGGRIRQVHAKPTENISFSIFKNVEASKKIDWQSRIVQKILSSLGRFSVSPLDTFMTHRIILSQDNYDSRLRDKCSSDRTRIFSEHQTCVGTNVAKLHLIHILWVTFLDLSLKDHLRELPLHWNPNAW